MKKVLQDLTGKTFGRLIVLGRAEEGWHKQPHWLCRCACGVEFVARGNNLKDGSTKSCGCLRREISRARMIAAPRGERGRVLSAKTKPVPRP